MTESRVQVGDRIVNRETGERWLVTMVTPSVILFGASAADANTRSVLPGEFADQFTIIYPEFSTFCRTCGE